MRQQERDLITAVIGELVDIQEVAPAKAIYTQGRTDGGLAYRLADVVDVLSDMVDDNERTTPTDE